VNFNIKKGCNMKLIIFGSTGSVGQHLVNQALEMGHNVTAFTRDAGKVKIEHNLLKVVEGNVLNYSSVNDSIKDKDIVFCTLGGGRKGKVRAEGTLNIIKAMENLKVRRLICQTTLGCGESWENLNFFWKKIMFGWFLKQVYLDHNKQEKNILNSNLDWTIIRPAAFTNGSLTKQFYSDFSPDNKSLKLKISRADLAYFMLQQLNNLKYLGKSVGISY